MVLATATLAKWGNSQGLIIPKTVCDHYDMKIGDKIEFSEERNGVLLTPCRPPKFERTHTVDLDVLFDGWEDSSPVLDDFPTVGIEVDWGSPKGQESW